MKNKKFSRKPKKIAVCLASILAGVALFIPAGCGAKENSNNKNPNNDFQIVVDSSIDEENQNLTITAGTTIATLKSQLEVEGYDLEGLYRDEDYTQPYDDNYVLQSGDKVYCKYEIKHFTITLNDEDWYEIQPQGEITNVEYDSEFKFKVTYTEDRDEAAIKVTANGVALTKGTDEFYTITIKADTTIDVQIKTYTITIPEQVTVKLNDEPLQTGATVRHSDVITVTYTKKDGYTQTVKVNDEPQTEETKTYTVTEDIVITYEEVATPYTLTINEQDKLDITLNGQPLDDITQIELHLNDELTITEKDTLEDYNQLIIVEGAEEQENKTYKVTGNVKVTYLEIDKQLYFTYNRDNECYEVKGGSSIAGRIVIPAIYTDGTNGVHKVEIPDIAFNSASKITEIVISEGIEKIGTRAFSHCSGIVSVTLPASLTTIESEAFNYCIALSSITLPEGLTTIASKAFDYCRKLIEVINKSQHIQLEKGSDEYGGVAKYAYVLETDESKKGNFNKEYDGIRYYENTNVQEPVLVALGFMDKSDNRKSITFKDSTIAIGSNAFDSNQHLSSIVLPEGLKQIDDSAFDSCTNLTKITWPTTGSLKRIGSFAFDSCFASSDDITLTLPEGLEIIEDYAFYSMGCKKNVTIILPTTLKSIGNNAFSVYVNSSTGFNGKIASVTLQSNIDFSNARDAFHTNKGVDEVIVRNAEIYKNITNTLNSQGNLFYNMQAGATIKVLKTIVDADANPMPDYLSQEFTKTADPENEEYYIFTKNS